MTTLRTWETKTNIAKNEKSYGKSDTSKTKSNKQKCFYCGSFGHRMVHCPKDRYLINSIAVSDIGQVKSAEFPEFHKMSMPLLKRICSKVSLLSYEYCRTNNIDNKIYAPINAHNKIRKAHIAALLKKRWYYNVKIQLLNNRKKIISTIKHQEKQISNLKTTNKQLTKEHTKTQTTLQFVLNKKKLSTELDDNDCPICLEPILCGNVQTSCNHTFCSRCYTTHIHHLSRQGRTILSCPLCREPLL
tara:strand:- start:5509 stop:6243 length:735 start_codon:yes stop_codon:yes gene_type:complete